MQDRVVKDRVAKKSCEGENCEGESCERYYILRCLHSPFVSLRLVDPEGY